MSMITATAWVPRGYPKQMPTRAAFDQEEFDRIQEIANLQLQDAQEDLEEARQGHKGDKDADGDTDTHGGVSLERTNGEVDDDLKEYDLEHYDDSPDEDGAEEDDDGEDGDGGSGGGANGMFGNVKNLVYHANNEEDPYITLHGDDAESDTEREELQILPTDNVLVTGRVEDEVAHLEFYVYEDEADNLYVHHDVMLPAIPLAVEWLNAPIRKGTSIEPVRGNYIAVGTMDADIEVWDLDVVDSMYPDLILGAGGAPPDPDAKVPTGKKKRRKKPAAKKEKTHHTASVLALAANPNHTNLLASASADTTIKLWNLNSDTPHVAAESFDYHTDKVCALDWHPTHATILLSGSYDRKIIASDLLSTSEGGLGRRKWTVGSDVEAVSWDPHDANFFYVTTEEGVVYYFDARTVTSDPANKEVSKPVWRLQAHDGPVSAFGVNRQIPGFLATGSSDKTVKLWDVPSGTASTASTTATNGSTNTNGSTHTNGSTNTDGTSTRSSKGPTLITQRQFADTGRIFSTNFAPDAEVAFRLAVAGSKGNVQVWDTSTNKAVRAAFGGKVKSAVVGSALGKVDGVDGGEERVTGVVDDSSDSESESEDGEGEVDGVGEGEGEGDDEEMEED